MACVERGLFKPMADHCSLMQLNALAGWHFIDIAVTRVIVGTGQVNALSL
jgi:hypothetical protein